MSPRPTEKLIKDREGAEAHEWAWYCEPCHYLGLENPAVCVRSEAADTPVCEWHDVNDYKWGTPPPKEGS